MNSLERPRTVEEFQSMFNYIFGELNKQRYSDDALIFRLLEEIAVSMELARKDCREEFKRQLCKIYSWYNAAATRLNINLQEALWYKYPGACPYCFRDRDCICGVEHPEIPNKEEILRRLRRERHGREPVLLRDHQLLHRRLYGWQNARIMSIQVAAHLVEEAGEVAEDFRHKNFDHLRLELADVASWMFALVSKLNLGYFDDLLWERYPYECAECHSEKCQCETTP